MLRQCPSIFGGQAATIILTCAMLLTCDACPQSHRYLQSLVLDNNQITSIGGLSECKQLTHLSLRYNQLTGIAGLENLPLKTLYLDHNEIASTEGLDTLKYVLGTFLWNMCVC